MKLVADTGNKTKRSMQILSSFHLPNITKHLENFNIVICLLKNLWEKLFEVLSNSEKLQRKWTSRTVHLIVSKKQNKSTTIFHGLYSYRP